MNDKHQAEKAFDEVVDQLEDKLEGLNLSCAKSGAEMMKDRWVENE